jgi:hypothetical protein
MSDDVTPEDEPEDDGSITLEVQDGIIGADSEIIPDE